MNGGLVTEERANLPCQAHRLPSRLSGGRQVTDLRQGWYPDPLDPDRLRFFDGLKWSDDVHPKVSTAEPPNQAGWFPDPLKVGRSRFYNGTKWTDEVRPNTSMPQPGVPDQHQTTSPDGPYGNNVADVGLSRALTGRAKAVSPTGGDNGAPPHDEWSIYASRAGSAETRSNSRPSPLPVILGVVAVAVTLILAAVAATRFSGDVDQQQVAGPTAEASTFVAGAPTLDAKIPDVVGFQVADAERILRSAGYDVTSSARSVPCSESGSGGWVKHVAPYSGNKVQLTTGCNDYADAPKTGEPTEAPFEGEVGEPPSEPFEGQEQDSQEVAASLPNTYEVRYEALGGAQVEGVYATSLGSVANSWVLSDRWSETVSLDPGNNAYFSLYHKHSNYGRPILCRIYVNGILEAESSSVKGGTANCQVYLP
jgi:hypothetical protein